MRLQKFLSRTGVASRRKAERLMEEGRVRVNGKVATELGTRVDPHDDRVEVDGRTVELSPPVWLALHKPRGYVTTRRDPRGRPTVYELIPPQHHGLFYVGRLDYPSEGLLLLTNQGDTAHRLLHPSFGVERVYDVRVEGTLDAAALTSLREGVELEDGVARAERIERLPTKREGIDRLRLTLKEGRKREVRRMLGAVGHPVRRLVRVRYGPIRLGDLPTGAWRELTPEEIRRLDAAPEGTGGRGKGPGRRRKH